MQDKLPKLNFPQIKLTLRERDGRCELFDTLRKSYVVLTPEEWVRRHLIALIVDHISIPPERVIIEYPVLLNGQRQRADIVVVDNDGKALLLCECKAPDVNISQATLDQAVRYNSVVKARYVILTNGIKHHLYECDSNGYKALSSLDDMRL